jgi:hypothetical protein
MSRSLREIRGDDRAVPFDRGHSQSANPETRAGLAVRGINVFGYFRTTERDKAQVREVVTARLMGDPAPDRVVPDIPESRHGHKDEPAPIYLTFREMRAAYGIEE